MRLAVYSTGKAADDDEPGRRELTPEHARDLAAVGRTCTRADDRDGRPREQSPIAGAAEVKTRRRIVNRPQERWQLALAEKAHWAPFAR
jgi:hypothetical protein